MKLITFTFFISFCSTCFSKEIHIVQPIFPEAVKNKSLDFSENTNSNTNQASKSIMELDPEHSKKRDLTLRIEGKPTVIKKSIQN